MRTRIFGLKQDITTEKALAEQTRFLAECEAVTGLANRAVFQLALAAVAAASRPSGALLLLDLDGFKQVNDRYGHAEGDVCLQQLATRLVSVRADAPLLARLGGGEFAVLIDRRVTREPCIALAELIIESSRTPVVSGSESFALGVSIGIARLGRGLDESDARSIFIDADLALYAAKSAGKNTIGIFERGLREKAIQRLQTIETIEGALAGSELALHYQPNVCLADGGLVGFEALLRHRSPPAARWSDREISNPRWTIPLFQSALDGGSSVRRCDRLHAGRKRE